MPVVFGKGKRKHKRGGGCKKCIGQKQCRVCGGIVHEEFEGEDYDNVYRSHACEDCGHKDYKVKIPVGPVSFPRYTFKDQR